MNGIHLFQADVELLKSYRGNVLSKIILGSVERAARLQSAVAATSYAHNSQGVCVFRLTSYYTHTKSSALFVRYNIILLTTFSTSRCDSMGVVARSK